MKSVSVYLLIVLLILACLDSMSLISAASRADSAATSGSEPQVAYTNTGNHTANDVDYWWISNVNQGEQVLVNVQISPNSVWSSIMYFSNLTEVPSQNIWYDGTHIHQFIASKTDNYLLRISGGSNFNYMIESTHPIAEQPMYTKSENLTANDVDYWWISSVSKDDQVLLDVQISPNIIWTSIIYYSNLTQVPSQNIWYEATHVHQFVATKTDSYLLRITSDSNFNYTIESTHSVAEQPMYTKSGNLTANDVDYWWVSNVNQGNILLLNVQISPNSVWSSIMYYSNLTEAPSQDIWYDGTHIHQFIASKTDNYLLRITGGSAFNYTIESTHPFAEQPMYTRSGIHNADSVNYHTLSGVIKGNQVLVDVQITPNSVWTSVIYFSNLTEVPSQNIWYDGTHIHQFVASKTDNYLLRITGGGNFSYIIESTHPIDAGQLPPTEIRFVLIPNPATVGAVVVLQGNLTSNGNPVPSAPVTIKLGVTPVGTLITNSTGWFKASGSVASAGTYNITVEYAGSPQYLPSSNWTILVVKEPTRIYCRIDPNPVSPGSNYTYEGILVNGYSQPLAGATIQLYNRTLIGPWTYITSVTTNSYGIFRWQGTAPAAGTYLLAAYYPGSATRESNYNYAALVVQ